MVDTGLYNRLMEQVLAGDGVGAPAAGASVTQYITTVQDDPAIQARQWAREIARGLATV